MAHFLSPARVTVHLPGVKGHSPATSTDAELLRRFAASGDEAAFAQLVRRHADLVFAASLRRVGNRHLAEDVVQAVFIVLARKAKSAAREAGNHASIGPWLLRTVRYAAANALKIQRRRRHHETRAAREASMRIEHGDAGANPVDVLAWRDVAPILDDCVLSLARADRLAVVMRHFERQGVAEIATALGVTHDAAKQRISRATGKLRVRLEKRGVDLSVAAVTGLLAAHMATSAPSSLITRAVIAAVTPTAATSSYLIAKGVLTMMQLTQLKTIGLVACVIATGVIIGVTTTAGHGNGPAAMQSTPRQTSPSSLPNTNGVGSFNPEGIAAFQKVLTKRSMHVGTFAEAVHAYVDANGRLPEKLSDAFACLQVIQLDPADDPDDLVYTDHGGKEQVNPNEAMPVLFESEADTRGGCVVGLMDGSTIYVVDAARLHELRADAGLEPDASQREREMQERRQDREAMAAEAEAPQTKREQRQAETVAVLEALKRYVEANGLFPRELADAAPYFEPADASFPTDRYDYRPSDVLDRRLNTGDLVRVTIQDYPFNERTFTDLFRVNAAGTINFPNLNEVRVAGLTETDAAQAVRQRLISANLAQEHLSVHLLTAEAASNEVADVPWTPDFSPPLLMERDAEDRGRFVAHLSGNVRYVVDERTLADLRNTFDNPATPATQPAQTQ